MSPAAFLLIAIGGSIIGSLFVLLRAREPKRDMHDTIAGFRRELAALSPERSPDADVRASSRNRPLMLDDLDRGAAPAVGAADDGALGRPAPRPRDASDYFGPLYGVEDDV